MSSTKFPLWAAATLAATVATLPLAALAAPTTIDFEGAFAAVGPGQPDPSYSEQGYRFTPSGGDAFIGPSFCFPGDFCEIGNGTDYLTAFNDADVTLAREDGSSFRLLSFKASFVPSPQLDYSGLDIRLLLSGVLAGGGTATQTVDLQGDGNGNFLFGSYAVDSSLYGAQSLTFGACFFDGLACLRGNGLALNDAQFAIDDLALSVPEPSALWLAGLALGGLVLTRRRAQA